MGGSVRVPKIIQKVPSIERICRTKSVRSVDERKSALTGWEHVFRKYSLSKQAALSPIKATEGNLKSTMTDDVYVEIYVWIVNMSEQHFYDNSFLLLSYSKDSEEKVSMILHRGFLGVDNVFFERLIETTILGEGSFGKVYSCRDPDTGVKYAVKHILAEFEQYSDHVDALLTYMSERNASIRAMESSLVVKFFYSLQLRVTGDLFLFFEFCIGDLSTYIRSIKYNNLDKVVMMMYNGKRNVIKTMYKTKKMFLETGLLYIFELLSGLDFLVRCNIIHQDIKPDNIMVSETSHLKIGDFGLTFRTRTIHKHTNTELMAADHLVDKDQENYGLRKEGTMNYQDLEIQMQHLELENKARLETVLSDQTTFNTPGISTDSEVMVPCFLVDTWAAGVTAIQLLFCGLMPLDPDFMPGTIFTDIPRHSRSLFLIHLITRRCIFTRYFEKGMVQAGGEELAPLMIFLVSILRPRLTRCYTFRKEKQVYHFSKLVSMHYVDMDKVELLAPFAVRNFSRSTIHLRQVSKTVRKAMYQTKTGGKRFAELLKEIIEEETKKSCPASAVLLEPGVSINFFT